MSLAVTILGCGSSGGVPRVGQGWGACDPGNPRNGRRRCAILITRTGPGGATRVLVDAGPDLRAQLLDARVSALDAVILTHPHADHTHGIDDLRPLVIHNRRKIPVYMDDQTAADVAHKFAYVFDGDGGYPPIGVRHRIEPGRPLAIPGAGGTLDIVPFLVTHGPIDALGLRVGDIAYTPDIDDIPPAARGLLEGLDVWIVDALRDTPHPSHFTVAQALDWISRKRPRSAVLTNLHTDLDYAALAARLPPGVVPAYDGMEIFATGERE